MFGKRTPRGRPVRGRPSAPRGGVDETVVVTPGASRTRSRASAAPAAVATQTRLLDLASEWLILLLTLRRATELNDPAGLRASLLEQKARLEQAAREHGMSAADVESAAFSLIAFSDESVLRSKGGARDAWISRPLQLELFGQNVAGEEFFTRLERLRRERQHRIEALEVAYACLAFGFLGKYGLSGPEKIQALIAEVEGDIAAVRGTTRPALAPNAVRRDPLEEGAASGIPVWLSVAVFVPALLLVWIILGLIANVHAGRVAGELKRLLS
jgi:type VI secretion system protein ImpK